MTTPANALDITAAGLVRFDGSSTFSGVTTTNHATLVGATGNGITSVGPSATAGQVLQSGGASANPSFSTASYPATAGTSLNLLQSDGTNFVSTAPIWMTATHTLTNSEIKNLHAVPIQLIAAPGNGKGLVLNALAARLNYGGNNAFTAGAGQTIGLYYNNTSNALITTNFISNTMITATANKFTITLQPLTSGFSNQAAGVVDNVNVALWNSVATEISGNAANDNTIDIYVTYTIVTF